MVPLLRKLPLIGLLMRANRDARRAYAEMIANPDYVAPERWDAVDASAYDGLLLPGGHRARGMRGYLESEILQHLVAHFFEKQKPVAAICHGVLLAARSVSKRTGRSVLHGYQTTALTWAFENSAWSVARFSRGSGIPIITGPIWSRPGNPEAICRCSRKSRARWREPKLPRCARGRSALSPQDLGLVRNSMDDETPAFVVRDRNYVSARWPGDIHTFAKAFSGMLKQQDQDR